MSYKPTVCFDFDGVINSHKSGFLGVTCIPDPPVEGISEAINELRDSGYFVVVQSTRCSTPAGEKAVRDYLSENGIVVDDVKSTKPPALCYIDDRAVCFKGDASTLLEQVRNFKPWTAGTQVNDEPVKALRPCKAATWVKNEKKEVTGRFHRWASDYQEFEDGPGNFTVALVETDDGKIVACAAETVQFLDRG